MGTEIRLQLGDLAQQTMTRTRGAEAVTALRDRATNARASRVQLDMSADSLISASFIDELVRQTPEMEREGLELVFVVTGLEMLKKFQKSVNWRRISCRYRLPDESVVRTLRPAAVGEPSLEVRTGTKSELPASG